MKKIRLVILLVFISIILVTCAKQTNLREDVVENNSLKKTDKLVIGSAMCTTETPYLSIVTKQMKDTAIEAGVELIMLDSQWNVETQIEQLEKFKDMGVDAIIFTPVNIKSLKETLSDIQKAGIPLINLNMKVDMLSTQYITTYVGSSSDEEAALCAQMYLDALGEEGGKIAIIEGKSGSDPTIYRTQTFVDELLNHPEIEILDIILGNWSRERSYLATLDLLNKYPNLDGIYCHDTEMAMGAIKAIDELEISRDIIITGISGKKEYYEAIKDGKLYGLVTQPPEQEAMNSIYCAIQAARGGQMRPWYKDPIDVVTIDNVANFL
jgi:ABC-type sugar transport system substrate-binding protein